MKIGKLPNSLLNKIVLEPINKYSIDREEVLVKPSIGEDCSALTIDDNICLLSTDPITGAVADIGKLAVHINSNDIAAGGGEPIGIMVTALLPPTITEEEIQKWSDIFENHRKALCKSTKPKTRNQIIKWLKNPHSDSAEYTMWGNGVALPCVFYVLSGIAHYAELTNSVT